MTREARREDAKKFAEAMEVMREVVEEMENLAGSGQVSELPEDWDDRDIYEKAEWFFVTVDQDDDDPHLYHAKALESPKWTADYVAESWGSYHPNAQAHRVGNR